MAVETKRICNGTFGELWLDGDYVGECYKAQAKVEFTKEEIKQCGTFFTDNKVVGCKGTGSLTMHKVNSRMAIKVVRDSSTGLSGVVWIDADTHTWQNGVATMSLTVTLKQMMDTKEG